MRKYRGGEEKREREIKKGEKVTSEGKAGKRREGM